MAISTDILTGQVVQLKSGELADAMQARRAYLQFFSLKKSTVSC